MGADANHKYLHYRYCFFLLYNLKLFPFEGPQRRVSSHWGVQVSGQGWILRTESRTQVTPKFTLFGGFGLNKLIQNRGLRWIRVWSRPRFFDEKKIEKWRQSLFFKLIFLYPQRPSQLYEQLQAFYSEHQDIQKMKFLHFCFMLGLFCLRGSGFRNPNSGPDTTEPSWQWPLLQTLSMVKKLKENER